MHSHFEPKISTFSDHQWLEFGTSSIFQHESALITYYCAACSSLDCVFISNSEVSVFREPGALSCFVSRLPPGFWALRNFYVNVRFILFWLHTDLHYLGSSGFRTSRVFSFKRFLIFRFRESGTVSS
ncbi:hypothetical protein SUGI_0421070 [Cryptomeria japonica]|nr:hypothetical protein SUGI_0421070 [Cryptomeria japonica]